MKTRTKHRERNYADVYGKFGYSFSVNGSDEAKASECPFCDGDKCYLNVKTGQYHCKQCDVSGNVTKFLTWVHGEYLKQTKPEHYKDLKRRRGIASQTLKKHELAYDAEDRRWLIPFKSQKGNVVNIQFYYPDGKQINGDKISKMNLPGLPLSIYNFHKLNGDKDKWVLLCEGPFDAIALDYGIGARNSGKYIIVATPGAFKEEWVEHFKDRKVRALYDNDKGGEQHAERVKKLLGESGVAAELHMLKWPADCGVNDINDLVKKYPNLSVLDFTRKNSVRVTSEPKLIFQHGKRMDEEDRPIDWIWPEHLRCGTYVSFSGRQGTFKTTIALELAARYTTGRAMPTMKKEGMPAGHVLYLHVEDDLKRVQEGFEQAGGNFDYWHATPAQTKDGDPLNVLDHLGEIEGMIREHDIRLVIIDGQNSVVGAPNISTDMQARCNVTNKLHQFAQKLNICLIGIRNEDAEGRALGAQSMADIGRCVLRAVEDEPREIDGPPYCRLEFVKVSDTARENYPPIPYSVKNHGGSHRSILWEKCRSKPPSKERFEAWKAKRQASAEGKG